MKKLKRLLAVLLCAFMSISVVACGGGSGAGTGDGTGDGGSGTGGGGGTGGSGDKTVINIQGYEAGVNLDWLRGLAKDFETLYATHSFEAGKTGVEFKFDARTYTDSSSMLQSNIHLYVHSGAQGADTGRTLAEKQRAISIDDIVSVQDEIRYDKDNQPYYISIREKVMPNYYNSTLCSADASSNQNISDWYRTKYGLSSNFKFNTCYAMPSYGLQSGLSYDAYNFNFYGFYLADPTWAAANPSKVFTHNSKFGSATFIKGSGTGNLLAGAVKACGNDGVFGTWDDGQPTSMEEFFILCDYMKGKSVSPLTAYGASIGQRNRIQAAFEMALAGADAYQARFNYSSSGEEVEVVVDGAEGTAFSAENAFTGIDYIKKANTRKVAITPENGYLAYRTAARYYSIALVQIAYEEKWYSAMSDEPTNSHLDAEEQFVLNGMNGRPACGMLIEQNYWYNEAKKAGSMTKFSSEAFYDRDGTTEPDIKWMSLPTKLYGTVSEGEGTPFNGVTTGGAPICLNARYKDDANIVALLKAFMKFIHSDEALSYYTGSQGVYRGAMDYSVQPADMSNLSSFQKSYIEAYASREKTIEPVSYEGLMPANTDQVNLGGGDKHFTVYQDGAGNPSTNAKNLFLSSQVSSTVWANNASVWQKLLQN